MDEIKEWFQHKVNASPEFITYKFFPALEKNLVRVEDELRQAEREGDLSKIKYAIGRFDGAHQIVGLLNGLKLSEVPKSEKRAESTSATRIMSFLGYGR